MHKLNPREQMALEWLTVYVNDGFYDFPEALERVTKNFNLTEAQQLNVKSAYETK